VSEYYPGVLTETLWLRGLLHTTLTPDDLSLFTLERTAKREVREEVGLVVEIRRRLCEVKHAYSHFSITLTAFECEPRAGEVCVADGRPFRWVTPDDLDAYAFPRANRKVNDALRLAFARSRRTSVDS